MSSHGAGRREAAARRLAPTISQVASEAGVSRATVSRAFNRPEMLRADTVARVRQAAEQLGYVPNQTARALSTGRYGNIALVVPDIANPFFPPLIRAAQAAADTAGFCVFLGDSDEDPGREDLLVAKLALQVEGFVLASSRLSAEKISEHGARRPLVLVNRDIRGIPRVLIDTAGGVTRAVEHLTELGHRRVAYVAGPASSWSNQQRRRAVRRAGQRFDVEVVVVPARRPTYDAGAAAVPALLGSGATAAVAFDDQVAQGLVAGLADRGITVPAQFSVVGCDDVLAATTNPPLTTVSSRCAEVGRVAVDVLLTALSGDDVHDVRVVLGTHLVVRATTAPPPRAALARGVRAAAASAGSGDRTA
jgi:LacI family transcriptional regulator